jgi:regulator of cell morphogenesis and NO signaling
MDYSVLKLQVLKRYNKEFTAHHLNMSMISPQIGMSEEFVSRLTRAFEDDLNFRYSEFNVFSTEVIVDYVRRTHKLYLHKTLHEIEQSISLLNGAYNQKHELLQILNNFYLDYKHDLAAHIQKEDDLLLPHIEYLENAYKSGFRLTEFYKQMSSFNIETFFEQHEENEYAIEKVRDQILNYAPPVTNRFIYGVLLNQLEIFEQDIKVHGLIEEQVLIPRALVLEKKLNERFENLVRQN